MARIHVPAALASCLVLLLLAPSGAAALRGDYYSEDNPGGSGWRGVKGYIENRNWNTVPPDGVHVSSIYVWKPVCNAWEGDGYNDGHPDENWIHIETGLAKEYGSSVSVMFWQFNTHPDGLYQGTWVQRDFGWAQGNFYVGEFKILNTSMGQYAPENWVVKYNSLVILELNSFGMLEGEALASAERRYVDDVVPGYPNGDGNTGMIRDLKRKNDEGHWSLWESATPMCDADEYYRWRRVDGHDYHLSHQRY